MFEDLYDNCTKVGLALQQLKTDIEKKTGEKPKEEPVVNINAKIRPVSIVVPMTNIVPDKKEAIEIKSDKIDKNKNFKEYVDAKLNEIIGEII